MDNVELEPQVIDEGELVYLIGADGEYLSEYFKLYNNNIIQARYTTIKPPELEVNTAAIFDSESQKWELVSDFRGMFAFNNAKLNYDIVDYLGELKDYHSFETGQQIEVVERN